MKKIIITSAATFFCNVLFCQHMDKGQKMMQYQRYQSAISIFQQQASKNKADTSAIYWLGIAYIKKEMADSAIAIYKNTLQTYNSPLFKAGLAQAYAAGKKPTALTAVTMLAKAEAVTSELLAIAIGNAYAQYGDYVKAENYYSRAISINPDNANNYFLLGSNALKKGDGNSVYKNLTKAISIDSNYLPAYFAFAKLYITQKNPKLYLPYLKKILHKDSLYAPAWYEMYRYAYYNEKDSVKKYYTRYLELSDKTEQQEYQLLVIDYNANKYQSVIDRAKKILKDGEANVPVDLYRYLGFSYYKTKDIIDAYTNMMHYLEVQDSSKIKSFDRYLIAQFAVRLQYKDSLAVEAIKTGFYTDTSVANKKYYAGALVNYFITAKDKYKTNIWREKLLPYKGINKVDMYKIGVAWFELDSLQRADSLFNEFVKIYPNEYKGIYMQAGIQAKLDSTMANGTAANYFEDFINKANGNTTPEYKQMMEQSYNYLGSYYLSKKDYGTALQHYTKLLQYQPNSKSLKKTVVDLKQYLSDVKKYNTKKNQRE